MREWYVFGAPERRASPIAQRPIFRFCVALSLLVAQGAVSGCYRWESIKPSELPKLNGGYLRVVGRTYTPSGTVTHVEQTVAHVERTDGTLIEIKGEYDARVTMKSRSSLLVFDHPVDATIEDGSLLLTGGNLPTTRFDMSTLRRVEVSQLDSGATIALSAVLGLVIGAAVLVVALSAVH